MVANYQFQNTLSSAIPAAPDLVPFGSGSFTTESIGGTPTSVYNFSQQQGLSLNTAGLISDNYTIAALFRFDNITGYRKILDFKNLSSDTGLYLLNGKLNFYSGNTGGPTVAPGTFLEAVFTRDSSTNLVTAYFDGSRAFSFTDSTFLGVTSASNLLNIFQDDNSTSGRESSSGSVARIQIFNSVLSDAEVAELNPVTPVPSPSNQVPGPLPILGIFAVFGFSRKLRQRINRV